MKFKAQLMINKILSRENVGLYFLLALFSCFILAFYSDVIFHPNSYLLSIEGDGIKNYFTYAYHIKHDHSFNHFGGMLYPYGDLHIMTDGHFLLSNALRVLSDFYPLIASYSIGILNFIIISSSALTAITLYLLLKSYRVAGVYAALMAMAILFLSPQWGRIYGHLSLSYSFFIPLVWYLVRCYNERKQFRFILYLTTLLLILYFTHPYMGVIGTLFILVHQFFKVLFEKENRNRRFIVSSLAGALLPLILFQIYVISIDNEISRPLNKFIYGQYFSRLGEVFIPHDQPFASILRPLFGVGIQDWEGLSYIGIATFLTLIFAFALGIAKKSKGIKGKWDSELNIAFYTGIVVLILALGFPFKYFGESILDSFPQIRQIRVMSRFSWVFYFTTNIFTAVFLFRLINNCETKNKWYLMYFCAIVYCSFHLIEGKQQHSHSAEISSSANLFDKKLLPKTLLQVIDEIEVDAYQALMTLPFFAIGGERLTLSIKSEASFRNSLLLSYHTGLPLMNNCLSRTSELKIENSLEPLIELYSESNLVNDLQSDKPILVYVDKKSLQHYDEYLFNQLSFLNSYGDFDLYEFYPQNVLKNKAKEVKIHYESVRDKWKKEGLTICNDSNSTTIFETFDQRGNDTSKFFRGGRSISGDYNSYLSIYKPEKGKLEFGKKYFISFWYYSKMAETSNIMFFAVETSPEGKESWTNVNDTRESLRTIKDWTYVKFPLSPEVNNGDLNIGLHKNTLLNPKVYVDQFLIWEQKDTVYYEYEGEIYKNNFPVFTSQ